MIRSLIGNATKPPIDSGFHLFSSFLFKNPFAASLSTSSRIGAVISKFPVGILVLTPFLVLTKVVPSFEAVLFMKVPRNFALPQRVLVISVFSTESSSFRPSKKLLMVPLRLRASFLLPQIPIIQSSAYLTYFKRVIFGLGIMDLSFLL